MKGWGRVIQGERGWRAEYAYPSRLWAPEYRCGLLAERWRVPVEPIEDALEEWGMSCTWTLSATSQPLKIMSIPR